MSRFTVGDGHLYVLSDQTLRVFRLGENDIPDLIANVTINDIVETIFYRDSTLFIGSQNGMHIYNVTSPSVPTEISIYSHIRSCDPVVVADNLAYVTLRAGSGCGRGNNVVEVIDVSNLANPTLLNSYDVEHPYGLAVADSNLLVCEGDAGLTVFRRDSSELSLVRRFETIDSYDVIALEKTAIITGADGIYQLNIENPNNITQRSFIPALPEIE